MEQRKITLRHERITPEAAQAIVRNEMYERQRPVEQSVVNEYALAMITGEFRQGTVISFCVYRGKRSLVNGQHTLLAIIRCGIAQFLGIEEIEVKSLEERAVWYGKYDRLRLRSLKQIYEAHGIHEALNFNKNQRDCLGAALPLLAAGFAQVPRKEGSMRMDTANPNLRMGFMHEWKEEAQRFFETIKGAPGTFSMNARRGPVMAVALVTIRYTGTDAIGFWTDAAGDDGLAQGDAR